RLVIERIVFAAFFVSLAHSVAIAILKSVLLRLCPITAAVVVVVIIVSITLCHSEPAKQERQCHRQDRPFGCVLHVASYQVLGPNAGGGFEPPLAQPASASLFLVLLNVMRATREFAACARRGKAMNNFLTPQNFCHVRGLGSCRELVRPATEAHSGALCLSVTLLGFAARRGRFCMEIKRVGVVGAGTMGNGIAHVFARSGYDVLLCDVEQQYLDRALEIISKNLDREAAKGKISATDKSAAIGRIEAVVDRGKLAACDFVVEAATEKFEIKAQLFRDLDRICRSEIILSSNTSSI